MAAKPLQIAVIVAGIDEEYQRDIIQGINQCAKENDINIAYFAAFGGMISSRKFDVGEYSIYNLIDFSRFDGAILMTNTISAPDTRKNIITRVRDSGIPAVIFDCSDYPEFCNISIDNSHAMKDIVSHVINQHGARVINYISGPLSNPEAKARYTAFLNTMKENGLTVDIERVFYGEFRSMDGKQAVDEFMSSGMPLPDAFICANDAMALTAVSELEKFGYKVPLDIIVTGFDNTYDARNFSPSLTSVKRPLEEMGNKACETLIRFFDGVEMPKEISLNAEAVYAESCGCNTADSSDLITYKKDAYARIQTNNENTSLLNRLTARLAESDSSDENIDAIEEFIQELGCEKFSLCLTEDWKDAYMLDSELDEGMGDYYSEYMTAPLIWSRGKRSSVEQFPSCEMFPEPFRTGGNISYLLPLHFRERCLGYYIITNGDFPIESLLCHTLTMNISNSLENVRKLFHLNNAMEELNRLYVIDPLCNIYNRNGFINTANEMFKECVHAGSRIMMSFIDMDGLKFINDNYGHNEGDFAIQRLAAVIKEVSAQDKKSICARFGGDEFVIFNADAKDSSEDALLRRFNYKMKTMNSIIKKPYVLSASVGSIVIDPDENTTIYNIIRLADEKMYEIKKKKKNSRTNIELK